MGKWIFVGTDEKVLYGVVVKFDREVCAHPRGYAVLSGGKVVIIQSD